MPPSDPQMWKMIRDWPLPQVQGQAGLFGGPAPVLDFAQVLEWDLIVTGRTARSLVHACRQWLYLCAVAGWRLPAADLIARVERAHRAADADWQALCDLLPGAALTGEAAPWGPQRDADYAATLAVLEREFGTAQMDRRFWPALWRIRVGRLRLGRAVLGRAVLGCGAAAVAGFGALGLPDLPHGLSAVAAVMGLVGLLGAMVLFFVIEVLTPYQNDDFW